MFKKISTSFTTILTSLLLLMPAVAHAAGASISLSGSRSTVPAGGSLIVAVYMNGGGAGVNAVQVDMNYPADKLQYVGFSSSGSAFEIGATSGGGGGSATLARGTTGSVSGSGLVGTVTFRALAGSGSASISVAGSSSLVADGNAVPYGSSGTSVNFGGVAAAPTTTSHAATPTAPAVSASPKDTSPPVMSKIKATNITPYSATVTWATDEPSDSVVEFGVDTTYGLSTSATTPTTAHSVNLSSAFLEPQTLLHFRVKSTDGAGNVSTGQDQTVELPGVAVVVVVRGPDGKPQPGARVTLDGDSGTTNQQGQVTLHSGLGNKKIVTSFGGVTMQQPITVNKTAKPLPPYHLDLAKQPLNHWMLTSAGLAMVAITLLGVDAVLFGSRLLARLTGLKIHRPLPAAALPAPTAAPEPTVTLSDSPETASEVGEPELDETKTIAELMGDPTTTPTAPGPPLLQSDPQTKPFVIQVTESTPTPVAKKPKPAKAPRKSSAKKLA